MSFQISSLTKEVIKNSGNHTALQSDVLTLQAPPIMIRRGVSAQSTIAPATPTTLLYGTELVNDGQVGDRILYDAGEFTIKSAGTYLITAEVGWSVGAAADSLRTVYIKRSAPAPGAAEPFRLGLVSQNTATGAEIRLVTTAVIQFTADQRLHIECEHADANNLDIGSNVDEDTLEISIVKLS